MGFVFIRKAILDGCVGQQPVARHGSCTTSTSIWRRPPNGGSRRPRMWSWRWHEAIAQFEAEGGPAGAAGTLPAATTRHWCAAWRPWGSSLSSTPAVQAPIIVTFHAPADPSAMTSRPSMPPPGHAASFSIPGKLTHGRDLPCGLHRRHRPRRDRAGRARRGAGAPGHGHCERRAGSCDAQPHTPKKENQRACRRARKNAPPRSGRHSPQVRRDTKVKVACSDIDGILRGKYLHRDKFIGAARAVPQGRLRLLRRGVRLGHAHDVCYDNTSGHRLAARISRRAGAHRPRHRAARALGQRRAVSSWASSSTPTEHRYPVCPRQTLEARAQAGREAGLRRSCAGMEFEWFNFAETPQSWAAKKGVSPEPHHAGHVRLLAVRMGQPEPRLLQRA
jgi:hypothetical protein